MSSSKYAKDRRWFNRWLVRFFLLCLMLGAFTVLWHTPFTRTFTVSNPVRSEAQAKEYNPLDKLIPALYPICGCESAGKGKEPIHFKNGKVLVGVSGDIGFCQINPFVHAVNAKAMLLNIYEPEGNIAYANYLYRRDGLKPWNSSKKCWGK